MPKQKRGTRHWRVYILRCRDGSLYTGITNDLPKRMRAHRDGTGSHYVRSRLPVELVYCESAAGRRAALHRELEVKRMTRRQKLILINKNSLKWSKKV
ncbi:MAG: GIY-YIG nuclease family protein [candidate division KSB1 bacterium]|nr:GIY-YIG nuclease family protein [candidate division KSB1 bacterium]MDZ7305148.1 GIY-YIG nuclease family protein [candidate division KSB1 bacterium]MDZ7314232.1 GIY-YIG nuclease family protein [candidate division KSB1 bacterium]